MHIREHLIGIRCSHVTVYSYIILQDCPYSMLQEYGASIKFHDKSTAEFQIMLNQLGWHIDYRITVIFLYRDGISHRGRTYIETRERQECLISLQSDQLTPWAQMTSSCRSLCMSFLYGAGLQSR